MTSCVQIECEYIERLLKLIDFIRMHIRILGSRRLVGWLVGLRVGLVETSIYLSIYRFWYLHGLLQSHVEMLLSFSTLPLQCSSRNGLVVYIYIYIYLVALTLPGRNKMDRGSCIYIIKTHI